MSADQESIPKLTSKNYTLWRLMIQDQLEKRRIFHIITDDRIRDRSSYSNQWNQHARQNARNKKQDALEYLLSTLSVEIYDEVKHLDQPIRVWEHLEEKYSKNSIKKLSAAMKELQTIKFTFENIDLFLESKFNKIVNKINDCGLTLDDNHLNLYLLSCLDKSKRLEDAKYFYDKLDCSFNEFTNRLKDKIVPNPEFKTNGFDDHYSDISNESFKDDDMQVEQVEPVEQVESNLKSLDTISSKIDENLKQFGIIEADGLVNQGDLISQVNKSASCSKDDSNIQNKDDLNTSRRIDQAFPQLLSPIRKVYQPNQKDNQLEDECSQTPKVYEDLTPIDQNISSFESPPEKHFNVFERERSPFFAAPEMNKMIEKVESKEEKSTILKDNFQLDDEQQTGENINLTEINLKSDPNYFFIDKNGSF